MLPKFIKPTPCFVRLFSLRSNALQCRCYISLQTITCNLYDQDSRIVFAQTVTHQDTVRDLKQLLQAAISRYQIKSLSILLATEYCRFLTLPASETFSAEMQEARISVRFQALYPSDTLSHFSICADQEMFNTPQLVVAVEKDLLDQVQAVLSCLKLRCQTITPLVIDLWNTLQSTLGTRNLQVQEGTTDTFLMQQQGQIFAVQQRPHQKSLSSITDHQNVDDAWFYWPPHTTQGLQADALLSYKEAR